MPNKHTPWKIGLLHPQNACAYVVDSEGNDVATLYGVGDDAICTNGIWSEQPIRDAHARLIAAAPEMLAALKRQRDNIKHWLETGTPAAPCESKSIFDQIESAIAKATGGSNAD